MHVMMWRALYMSLYPRRLQRASGAVAEESVARCEVGAPHAQRLRHLHIRHRHSGPVGPVGTKLNKKGWRRGISVRPGRSMR